MRTEHFGQILAATEAFFAVEKAHPDCPHTRELHAELWMLRKTWSHLMTPEQNAAFDSQIVALGGGTNKD